MLIIDKFAYQSRWRSVGEGRKAALYALCLLLAFCLPLAKQALLFAALMMLTCHAARLSVRQYLAWLALPSGFLLLSLLVMVLTSAPRAADLIVALPWWGDGYLGISDASLMLAVHTAFRALCCLAATLFFVLTTPFEQCLSLLKRAHLPLVLIEQVMLTYRFIFIFIEEAQAIFNAQTLRFGYGKRRVWLRSLAMLVGLLLERVLIRQQKMQLALEAKLYQGDFHL
ncbi:cobalt/nickel transport system permease protein [Vibrio xiamenensis]|uniref:Cobalt/nickel transport system permease protein n=1 Tax=Vibrio xiamenensis TaxID=861298 RepID=A0A1G8AH50_9VIBR|nr:cobalt ECF transporter T component CbiQ [Vibrio xiamenensis]SDH20209.1 cobalt/nickel transport system permease protein [Vibrio xiamenensis]